MTAVAASICTDMTNNNNGIGMKSKAEQKETTVFERFVLIYICYLFPLDLSLSFPNLDVLFSSGFSPFSDSNKSLSRLSDARYGPKK